MSHHPHPDADGLIRRILENPADALPRLVFADWLDETGDSADAAWAGYIRARAELRQCDPAGPKVRALLCRSEALACRIRAPLALSAGDFIAHADALIDLLPAARFKLDLTAHHATRSVDELVPESVARENRILPLRHTGLTPRERMALPVSRPAALIVAAADPSNTGVIQKLAFILNRHIVAVAADPAQLQDAIDRHYGPTDTEPVDSILVEFPEVELSDPSPTTDGWRATSPPITG